MAGKKNPNRINKIHYTITIHPSVLEKLKELAETRDINCSKCIEELIIENHEREVLGKTDEDNKILQKKQALNLIKIIEEQYGGKI